MKRSGFLLAHVLLLLVVLAVTGFIRDDLFKSINYQIARCTQEEPLWHFTNWLAFLNKNTLDTYITYKWVFTLLFFLFHWGFCLYLVRMFFRNRLNYRITHLVFLFLLAASGLVYVLFGVLMQANVNHSRAYEFARMLMGAGQSPVVVMLLTAVYWVRKKSAVTG